MVAPAVSQTPSLPPAALVDALQELLAAERAAARAAMSGLRWVIRRIRALLPAGENAVLRTHEVNSLAYAQKKAESP